MSKMRVPCLQKVPLASVQAVLEPTLEKAVTGLVPA